MNEIIKIKKTDLKKMDVGEVEDVVRQAIVNIEKKDYRATLNLQQETTQVPDAMTAFIDVAEDKKNTFGFNRELDVKGTISPFQVYFSQTARFAQALAELKNWEYIERKDEDGNIKHIEIDLMSIDAEENRWLSLSLFGTQSEKEIRLMRAGFGLNEETSRDKTARWFGLVKKKKSDVYENNY